MRECFLLVGLVLTACAPSASTPPTAPARAATATAPSAPPAAKPARPKMTEAQLRDTCGAFSELATVIMQLRQHPAPMAQVMALATDARSRALVVAAYGLPRLSVAENRARAATDFGNEAYLACVTQNS